MRAKSPGERGIRRRELIWLSGSVVCRARAAGVHLDGALIVVRASR